MANNPWIGKGLSLVIVVAAALSLSVSCDAVGDATDAAETKIRSYLSNTSNGIYERNNIPEETPSTNIKGYYDIIGGAYRYIINEDPADSRPMDGGIEAGDRVSFYFDARVFSSTYDNSTTYFTNIGSRIEYISNNNPQFDITDWSSEPLEINVGYDTGILKSLQNALLSSGPNIPACRPGDEVRIFLPPNVGYGNTQVYMVPAKSTLVFELTNIEIIE